LWGEEGKVVFIREMKAEIGARGRESGVHKRDESRNLWERKGKWCS